MIRKIMLITESKKSQFRQLPREPNDPAKPSIVLEPARIVGYNTQYAGA